ncbi:hypothetical protein MtrunA17_Chr6g0450611 [Medicago truncatula]|uniref:DUF1645 family protein n=1 Tax=Medicago truncatula TaxID=3880 RepID=G7KIQ4_MEDTR|nr:uncharacterized protein LOC11425315 [Medicago truncatula]AES74494.1 DUF1645 family protein [Medicago truncatula]RHN49810.1 hypothetical protein MtrunA17_Chr6g0450611 [Medicago truncatula]
MQNQQQNEETSSTMDSFLCPSFSTYSSNNINDVVQKVTNENDTSNTQNDNDDFEFVAFHNHRRNDVFPIFNHDGNERRNSDAAEISNSLKKLLIGDEKQRNHDGGGRRRNSDVAEISNSLKKLFIGNEKEERNRVPSSELEDDLDSIPAETYCLWTPNSSPMNSPKSPITSPVASPMNSLCKCKKSNSTGSSSSSSSSSRWKFLSLLRRSKSDGKESLNLLTPVKKENLKKLNSGEKNVAGKKIPVTEKKTPATVSAMEVFYRRKKESRVKSYLPYKKELIGFSVGFNANIGRGFPLHV